MDLGKYTRDVINNFYDSNRKYFSDVEAPTLYNIDQALRTPFVSHLDRQRQVREILASEELSQNAKDWVDTRLEFQERALDRPDKKYHHAITEIRAIRDSLRPASAPAPSTLIQEQAQKTPFAQFYFTSPTVDSTASWYSINDGVINTFPLKSAPVTFMNQGATISEDRSYQPAGYHPLPPISHAAHNQKSRPLPSLKGVVRGISTSLEGIAGLTRTRRRGSAPSHFLSGIVGGVLGAAVGIGGLLYYQSQNTPAAKETQVATVINEPVVQSSGMSLPQKLMAARLYAQQTQHEFVEPIQSPFGPIIPNNYTPLTAHQAETTTSSSTVGWLTGLIANLKEKQARDAEYLESLTGLVNVLDSPDSTSTVRIEDSIARANSAMSTLDTMVRAPESLYGEVSVIPSIDSLPATTPTNDTIYTIYANLNLPTRLGNATINREATITSFEELPFVGALGMNLVDTPDEHLVVANAVTSAYQVGVPTNAFETFAANVGIPEDQVRGLGEFGDRTTSLDALVAFSAEYSNAQERARENPKEFSPVVVFESADVLRVVGEPSDVIAAVRRRS